MRVVILAGGRGTRLAPFTMVLPKPLVPIGDMPVLEILIRQLKYFGLTDVTVSLGYLGELIEAYFAHRKDLVDGLTLGYVREPTPLGTAGSLALTWRAGESLLVLNGDILTSLDFRRLIEAHERGGAALTIATNRKGVRIDLGVLQVDAVGMVTGYIEKPQLDYLVSMGVYVYSPKVRRYVKSGERLDFPDLVQRLLAAGERVAAYETDAYWLDIGRPEDHARATEEFEPKRGTFHID
jgi:NDP-sugar pyrophosphorylase family protein